MNIHEVITVIVIPLIITILFFVIVNYFHLDTKIRSIRNKSKKIPKETSSIFKNSTAKSSVLSFVERPIPQIPQSLIEDYKIEFHPASENSIDRFYNKSEDLIPEIVIKEKSNFVEIFKVILSFFTIFYSLSSVVYITQLFLSNEPFLKPLYFSIIGFIFLFCLLFIIHKIINKKEEKRYFVKQVISKLFSQ